MTKTKNLTAYDNADAAYMAATNAADVAYAAAVDAADADRDAAYDAAWETCQAELKKQEEKNNDT